MSDSTDALGRRARPRLADREGCRPARGLPATRAGIYLNTGTVGPLPAEAAAAMAGDRRSRARRRSRDARSVRGAPRPDGRGARRWWPRSSGTEIDLVALTHSTTEGINLALGTIDWRPGDRARHDLPRAPGRHGPAGAAPRPARAWRSSRRRSATAATTTGRWRRWRPRLVGGRRGRSSPRTSPGPPGRCCRSAAIARAGATMRGGRHPRRRPVGRGDPAGGRRDRGRLLRGQRPEVAARAGGDGRARGRAVASSRPCCRRWAATSPPRTPYARRARRPLAGRAAVRDGGLPQAVASSASPGAPDGSACSSACRGRTNGQRGWRPARPTAWRRCRASRW